MDVDKLVDIVNTYNNTYHSTIKVKPVNVESRAYIDFDQENDEKDHKFNVDDHVRILKYKNIFGKGYVLNWSEEVFVITKVKNAVLWIYSIGDLNVEENNGTFYKRELQKQLKKNIG